jgi:hypothetical protein
MKDIEKNNVPKIIFIVPYRNRENEKIHFSVYMNYIMEDYEKNDYEIYYSHQTDSRPFNRGATKNIGFLAMKEKYPNDYKNITFVFNDIDTIPFKKNILNYGTIKGIVKHFYGVIFALGGIFSINGEDFERCNGFPNNWGWGLEDNEMNRKVLNNKIKIDRAQFYPIGSKEILQIYDSPIRLINNDEPKNYITKNNIDNLNNISQLNYTIENNNENNNENNIDNEFIIQIYNFNTLINPTSQMFYTQDIFKDKKLHANKKIIPNRWKLNNTFNQK